VRAVRAKRRRWGLCECNQRAYALGVGTDAPESELVALAEAWAEAIVANDVARITEFVTEDWVLVSASGISAGAEFLALVESGRLSHSAMTAVGGSRVRVWGDTAVLTARVTNTAHFDGQRFDADEWTTDVFVRRHGRWRCAVSHYTGREPAGQEQGQEQSRERKELP
jgi:ketosteroid isomerase-like protein